ncbi:MAG: hypothetical protein KJ057_09420 [Phycisphaerae bacterium]|nr:MAG: hypothetical protein EDS66_12445 [Planctomycetota bacterium]KAB2949938.1 MAG: hypothetical protein F9K17_01170 [Phycisphaerae bacterium]MBE7458567.1 hypothetical protein [Planctomycetia bacterium]MCK6465024.1 hypothetical protein [Phycisphaerae bacterium]MCL4718678.1 hypothetical protein [Phycisphaerae bacterium]
MAANRKYKIYGAVIAVGAVALAADRFLGGASNPELALAGTEMGADGSRTDAVRAQVVGSSAVLLIPFPRSLPPFDESIDAQADMFARPEERGLASPTATVPKVGEDGTPLLPVEEFIKKHRLEGTLVGIGEAKAFISGRTLTVGAKLDGFEAAFIGPDGVLFRRGEEVVTLKRPEPLAGVRDGSSDAP